MGALEELLSAGFGAWRMRQRPRLQSIGLFAVAGLLVMLGALYLSFAVYLALAEQAGPPIAAALTSALLLMLAILLVLSALLINRINRRAPPESDAAALAAAVVRVGDLFGHKVERPATTMAIAALAAGLITGVSPGVRKFLLNLVDQLFKELSGEPK